MDKIEEKLRKLTLMKYLKHFKPHSSFKTNIRYVTLKETEQLLLKWSLKERPHCDVSHEIVTDNFFPNRGI